MYSERRVAVRVATWLRSDVNGQYEIAARSLPVTPGSSSKQSVDAVISSFVAPHDCTYEDNSRFVKHAVNDAPVSDSQPVRVRGELRNTWWPGSIR